MLKATTRENNGKERNREPAADRLKAPAAASGSAGSVEVKAHMPGKIVDVKVKPGDTVKKGDVAAVLEAMKMENEIGVPQDGTIATVEVSVGDAVEGGDILITME